MNQELLNVKWTNYKNLFFNENSPYNEKYKWSVLKQVSDKWNWNTEDKIAMFKAAFEVNGSNNLWTSVNYYPIKMAQWFFEEFPKETINAFTQLFNEQNDLLERLNSFKNYFNTQLKVLQSKYPDKKLNYHSQDIRSMSLYLFVQNPEKYALYKYSFAKAFSELIDLGSIRRGQHQNYISYLQMLEEVKKSISNENTFLSEYLGYNKHNNLFLDESYHLLIQDFMYCTVQYSAKQNVKYWLYSPGEQAYKWEEFYNSEIMALGWDALLDLNQYESREAINQALVEAYGGSENKPNDTTANDDFLNQMNLGDVIIVKKGLYQLLGYGIVESDYYFDETRNDYLHCRKVNWKKKGSWNANHTLVLKTLTEITNYKSPNNNDMHYYEYLMKQMDTTTQTIQKYIDLLIYKKQIILQGPPGTGKTRLAKEIAEKLLDDSLDTKNMNSENLSDDFLHKIFNLNDEIRSSNGSTKYIINEIKENSIVLSGETRNSLDIITFDTLRDCINYPEKFPLGTGLNSQYRAVANFANEILKSNSKKYSKKHSLKENNQFKLIQFHPSYTYEDFVRGIVAKPNPNGDGIIYDAENKTLGKFAKDALKNFQSSRKRPELASKEIWVELQYQKFKDDLEQQLEDGKTIVIKDKTAPKIIAIEESAIRVKRYDNENDKVLLKDNDIILGYIGLYLNENPVGIKENDVLSKSARSGMYYLYQNLVSKFKSFLDNKSLLYKPQINLENQELKKYILIIDEINRANLSSVLGELIYALEYRGEKVESMYAVDYDNKLILPPNLYIIGTMNTADRSVGHIDYAIRRRFAFVDVLPQDLSDDNTIQFDTTLFNSVKALFTTDEYKTRSPYLSNEFDPKDVALGHSYFIDKSKDGGSMQIRLEYEIKPILREYVKDGVLIGDNIIDTIENLEASI